MIERPSASARSSSSRPESGEPHHRAAPVGLRARALDQPAAFHLVQDGDHLGGKQTAEFGELELRRRLI